MPCPKCSGSNTPDAHRCIHCGASLSVALLEVVRGSLPEKIYFLKPRSYSLGRARHNDLALSESSVSKSHARLIYEEGTFFVEDQGSLHGVYVNGVKIKKLALSQETQIQMGNVTLRFSLLGMDGTTDQIAEYPWIEQQQLVLSIVQALNSTLVLSQVLEQVLDAVMRITRAERGFLLLSDSSAEANQYENMAGLQLRVGRRRGQVPIPLSEATGISKSVIRRALETGETVATGNAVSDPALKHAESVITMDLRTIVCIPLFSPRVDADGMSSSPRVLGAIYVDNQETSAPFSHESLRTAEALARHAALAIENAQLFEREQKTIEELRQAQTQLLQSEKLATIGQMAAGIAHELNTPLTYIVGNLELLQAREIPEAQREMLDSIAKGAERIRSLAQRLLAFSRPAREELLPLSPNDVVERSLEMCHYQMIQSGVHVRKELAPDLPRILGVSNQLETAIINLVVNAIHAMGQGGTLTVRSTLRADAVEIAVEDTGPGIPESMQASLFEPFTTTKPEGQGTGLGLSTVLMVAERHKGKIDFSSRPGAGTVFRLSVPAAP